MKNRTRHAVSVLLLTVYGVLALAVMPLHHHDDPLFQTGSGHVTVAQHDDALNCSHHHIAEIHDSCTVCSVLSHSQFTKVVAVIPPAELIIHFFADSTPEKETPSARSSHPHRGPPIHFA